MEELIPITMFMCIAAVAILRPLTKKLGGLLDAVRDEKAAALRPSADPDIARMRVLMEHVAKRMDLMEERLDFTERLLNGRRAGRDDMFRRETELRSREAELLRASEADAL